MNTLGDRLRELRSEINLEQKELAKILNVHKGTVSNWENDKRSPDKEMISKIASYFDVTTDYLLCRTNDKGNKNQYNPRDKAKEILEVLKKAGIDLENIDYEKLEQLLKLANIEKQK